MKFLRQQTINELKLFNYSSMTIKNYVEAISVFSRYHGKAPDKLGEKDIKTFLLYSQRRGLAPSTMRTELSPYFRTQPSGILALEWNPMLDEKHRVFDGKFKERAVAAANAVSQGPEKRGSGGPGAALEKYA